MINPNWKFSECDKLGTRYPEETMTDVIALVDCNNFYASCEKLFRPDIRDRPVVVLSNNDGCVVARSREAKSLGIKMGGTGISNPGDD